LMGRIVSGTPFYTISKTPITKRDDFEGRTFGGTATTIDLVKALGAEFIQMRSSELYGGLQRGLIDTTTMSMGTIKEQSLYEVAVHCLDVPFYGSMNFILLVNLDVWNSLPKDLQDMMSALSAELDSEIPVWFSQQEKELRSFLVDQGMEFHTFSTVDEVWFKNLANEACWDILEETMDPKEYAELRSYWKK